MHKKSQEMYLKLFFKLFFQNCLQWTQKAQILQIPSEHDNKCIIFVDFFVIKVILKNLEAETLDKDDHTKEERKEFTRVFASNNFHL